MSWSAGSLAIGPYAAAVQHSDKVDSLFLLAPIFNPNAARGSGPDGFSPPLDPTGNPIQLPRPGTPMTLTTRQSLKGRWDPEIEAMRQAGCEDVVEEGIQDVVWNAIMDNDELGRTWGPPPAGAPAGSAPEGVMRVRSPFPWGWNSVTAPKVSVPALIIFGEFDSEGRVEGFPVADNSFLLYDTIPHDDQKLLFKVACAGHSMPWERQRRVLHHISKQWLKHGAVEGFTRGRFFVDTEGNLTPLVK